MTRKEEKISADKFVILGNEIPFYHNGKVIKGKAIIRVFDCSKLSSPKRRKLFYQAKRGFQIHVPFLY